MRNINPGVPIAIHAMENGIRRLEQRDLDAEERYRVRYHARACQNAMALACEDSSGFPDEWRRLEGLIRYIMQATEPCPTERQHRQAMH